MPHDFTDFESNPFVLTGRGTVALDVLVRLGASAPRARPPRPLAKLERLHQDFADDKVDFDEFEERKQELLDQLE